MLPKLCLNTCLPSVHSLLLCAWSFRTRALISDHDYITLLKYITFVSKLNSKTILFLRYMRVYHRLKIHSPSKVQKYVQELAKQQKREAAQRGRMVT